MNKEWCNACKNWAYTEQGRCNRCSSLIESQKKSITPVHEPGKADQEYCNTERAQTSILSLVEEDPIWAADTIKALKDDARRKQEALEKVLDGSNTLDINTLRYVCRALGYPPPKPF